MSVFVVCHRPDKCYVSALYRPICVGNKKERFPQGTLRDDTGENIAFMNDTYNELTALYRVWKDDELNCDDYIGLAHYRRYLGVGLPQSHYYFRSWERAEREVKKGEENFLSLPDKPDLIAPYPARHQTVERYYAAMHGNEDILLLLSVIDEYFPYYSDCAHRYFSGSEDYLCNLFIMKRELFMRYAQWTFDVIKKFTEARPVKGRLFISERITGIFIQKMIEEDKDVLFAPMIVVERKGEVFKKALSVRGRAGKKALLRAAAPTFVLRRYYRGVYGRK